jgi:hypothetical protein
MSKHHGTKPMHPSSSRAFQRHQEHDLKHPHLVDLITTIQNKTNQTTSIDRCSHNFRLDTCISVKKGILCIMESQFSSRCMHLFEERLSIICTHSTSNVNYMFRQVGVKIFDAQILHQRGVSFLGAEPAIKKQKRIQVLECSSITCKHK